MNESSRSRGTSGLRSPHGVAGVLHRSRVWNGVTVHSLEITLDQGPAWSDLSSDHDNLSVVLDVQGGVVETRAKVDVPNPAHRTVARPISFVPSRMPIWGYTDGAHFVRESRLEIDFAALEARLEQVLDRSVAQEPRLTFEDDRIWRTGALLAQECDNAGPASDLYGDSLIVALFVDLLGTMKREAAFSGRLVPRELRRAIEFMEGNLDRPIALAAVAKHVGLSQWHFGRAFKAATGFPPHRWLMNARIARARRLLEETDLPLTDIALATGFGDHGHFSRVFRRFIGVTPVRWRQSKNRRVAIAI